MVAKKARTQKAEGGDYRLMPDRRQFIAGMAAAGIAGWGLSAFGVPANGEDRNGLPPKPQQQPLDFARLSGNFDAYIVDPAHGVVRRDKQGRQFFTSALEATEDGGLTCFGAVAMGKELAGTGLEELGKSLQGYYSEKYGLFLDGPGASLCEYWYLMNITAMAFGLIRLRFEKDPEWLARVESTATKLRDMAQQIHYNFNDQGFDYAKGAPFTLHDIYRQPDAVGGYSYVMLLAWKLTGKDFCLAEAKTGIDHYLAFTKNPWYEVPSGSMAVMAAARLAAMGYKADAAKGLSFVFDSQTGPMARGDWSGHPVNGLMAGFSTEPPGEVYSMESMVTLPYILPAVRYQPQLAADVARHALNVSANLRWFYPEYLPHENQSRPDLPSMVPYERLSREVKGHTPYAEGDYAGHRSVYGGAYVMWLHKMIQPQSDPWLLRWDLNATNFLDRDLPRAYLYYNPGPSEARVHLEAGQHGVRDVADHTVLKVKAGGSVEILLQPQQARVIELLE